MTWRNWSFIVLVVLANYIVFTVLGSYIFTPSTDFTPTHTAQPTFTPGARALTPVAPLPYTFLTPSPIVSAARTGTAPAAGSPISATLLPTASATRSP